MPALFVSIVPLLFTCAGEREPAPVFLISIDTLRSDHLSAYGSSVRTPAIDAFAADAVLFERAYSHSPLTLPSHATILSGLLPAEHGVRDNTGFRVNAQTPLLQSILAAHGYTTGAAVSAYVLRRATRIDRGFGTYDDDVERDTSGKSLGAVQRRGEDTVAAAERWLAASPSRPFYFLHLYEPHAPYGDGGYAGDVAAADGLLGRFFDALKARGLYDRALIVVLSDHGEGLGDHGEDEHGIFLYREAIQVPLLVKLPENRLRGTRVAAPVGLADVMPTVLGILGIDAPKTDGRALVADGALAALPPRPVYSETWYPRFHFGWSELHSLVDGDEHFIDAPRPELYDVRNDPRETKNVLEERRRRFVAMRQAIAPLKRAASAPAPVSAEDAAKLAALGYIGSAAPAEGPLPDPKDKTGVFRELQQAFRFYREGKDAEALAAFDRLLRDEPDMVDLWDVRAKVLFRMGRMDEAIASGKEALRRSPTSATLAVDLAQQLLLAGRLDEAKQHAELAVNGDPGRAREILARIALFRGDLDTAQREATAAGDNDAARYTLARVAQRKGDYATVERLTATLVTRRLPGLHALRGDALARLGRDAEAEQAFREELRLVPASPEANRGLIVLLVTQGRTEEATQVVRAFANAAPTRATYAAIA
ncbi:MAG TPA: sulfatase-like hydrolase/transferase, partial [Thermoanaerobaculia bacterium]|nr:sulfatase-like hydrolase/transferase [Thermoanaerobaculia bacterium]